MRTGILPGRARPSGSKLSVLSWRRYALTPVTAVCDTGEPSPTSITKLSQLSILVRSDSGPPVKAGQGRGLPKPHDPPAYPCRSPAEAVKTGNGCRGPGQPWESRAVTVERRPGTSPDMTAWSAVIEHLQADGYRVTAPQFPMSRLADDLARLRQVLARQNGPTVVAGTPTAARSSPPSAPTRPPAEGRNRSRHHASAATSMVMSQAGRSPQRDPVSSPPMAAAPRIAQARHLQPRRQASRSSPRRRR